MQTFSATPNRRWLEDPYVNLGSSLPVRVLTREEDPDFKPLPLLGFTTALPEKDPALWEGDNA